MDYDYSPTTLKKVVYAGTQATSFPQGSRDLKELAELEVSPERLRRATERIGAERVAERDAQAATYETPQTAPSAIVAKSLGYLRNQRSRMDYPEYRRQGLPMTSTYVESTVKQINRRMKGTEKFWSRGVEGMLTLVADHLGDTPTLARFWRNRPHRLTGSRCDRQVAA